MTTDGATTFPLATRVAKTLPLSHPHRHARTVQSVVDVDSYIRRNEPTWARLDDLTRRAERGVGRLPAAELDELVRLYQRVSTHLSYARTFYRDPALTAT